MTRQTLTERLGRHTWNQINNQHEGKTGSQGTHGEQNTHKTVQNPDISPPLSEGASSHRSNIQRGGACGNYKQEEQQFNL